jgi:hypothetical protein
VEQGVYQAHLIVSTEGPDGTYFYSGAAAGSGDVDEPEFLLLAEEGGDGPLDQASPIGDFDVFIRFIRTTSADLADQSQPLYAGSTVTFEVNVENDETLQATYDNIFSNLLLVVNGGRNGGMEGGADIILATQQGIEDITVDLPPYLRDDDYDFRIELSQGGPLGDIGDEVGESDLLNLEDDIDANWDRAQLGFFGVQFFENFGRDVILTRTFDAGELEGTTLLVMELEFNQFQSDLEETPVGQELYFEVSVDGQPFEII